MTLTTDLSVLMSVILGSNCQLNFRPRFAKTTEMAIPMVYGQDRLHNAHVKQIKNRLLSFNFHSISATNCIPKQSPPTNGKVSCTNANRFGSICRFTCNAGYYMLDNADTMIVGGRDVR